MVDSAPTDTPDNHAAPDKRRSAPVRRPKERAGRSGSPFRIYKPRQGHYVRWSSAAAAGLITVAFGNFVYNQLAYFENITVQTLLPVAAMAVMAWLVFYLIGQRRGVVDFMIATEGEMKKVNWSTRREILGATKVVIFTVVVLSFLLFAVDIIFILFFSAIGILKVNVLGNMFGGGET